MTQEDDVRARWDSHKWKSLPWRRRWTWKCSDCGFVAKSGWQASFVPGCPRTMIDWSDFYKDLENKKPGWIE